MRLDRVEAPWLIDGPINGERFRLYVEKVLLPTLRSDDIVVIGNLGSHRGKAIRRIIRSVGAKLFFLPKYSPDLNPIEQLFAKLKHWLRNAAVAQSMPCPTLSATSSAPSQQTNAPITSPMQDINPRKLIPL